MKEGKIGELVYCLHKMGFNGGEADVQPLHRALMALPYSHLKAFLAHPFAVMRHFCGDITHVQAFVDRPGVPQDRAGDAMLSIASIHVRFANGCVGYLLSQRGDCDVRPGRLVEPGGVGHARHVLHRELHREDHLLAQPLPAGAAKPEAMAMGASGGPETMNTGITDFGADLPAPDPRLPRGRDERGVPRGRCAPRAATRWPRSSTPGRPWSPTSRAGSWCSPARCRRFTATRGRWSAERPYTRCGGHGGRQHWRSSASPTATWTATARSGAGTPRWASSRRRGGTTMADGWRRLPGSTASSRVPAPRRSWRDRTCRPS